MSAPLLLLVSGIYLTVAGTYAAQGRWGMFVAFTAYALANLGFIMDLKR